MISNCHAITAYDLRSHLIHSGLDVLQVITQKNPDYKWVRLSDSHHVMDQIMEKLEGGIMTEIKQTLRANQFRDKKAMKSEEPYYVGLQKIDITHDYTGTFYIPGDWKKKRLEILKGLKKMTGKQFKFSSNSFESCLHFEE